MALARQRNHDLADTSPGPLMVLALTVPAGYGMRNAFEAVPRELEEAAVVYGANSWQVLRRGFMPTIVPAVITVTLSLSLPRGTSSSAPSSC